MSKLVCTYRNFRGRRGARYRAVEATIVGIIVGIIIEINIDVNVFSLLGMGFEEARSKMLKSQRLKVKEKVKQRKKNLKKCIARD